ncbi:FAD dependent oxidoreductase [Aspergillus ambiguus]|uniref:NAD(P)/FAD-dependent oxidoreductase n=1 Tax=Aspergillus ambiguus TaxID=176160 RepID=UPI003CCCFCAB
MTQRAPPAVGKTDSILIVGAGVFGLTTALELSSRGYSNITVLDRYPPPVPDGSSVDISRIIRTDYADALYSRMAQEALRGWKTDYQDHYHHSGFAILSETPSNPYIAKIKDLAHAEGRTLHEYPNANDLKHTYPSIDADLAHIIAYHNPEGGWADAASSISHLAHRCRAAGVAFRTGPAGTVTALQTAHARVTGVHLATGDQLPAAQVILSTGAWTNLLADLTHATSASGQPVGFIQLTPAEAAELRRFPVMINLTSGVFVFPPTPDTHVLKVARHGYGFATRMAALRGHASSAAVVSAPKRDANNAASSFLPADADDALRAGLRQLVPRFSRHPWSNRRLCWYTDTPEGDFVVDHHPSLAGLFVATGGAGHAFKFLPVLGRYVADCFEGCAVEEVRRRWRLRVPGEGDEIKAGDGSKAGPPLRVLTEEEQREL